jgi:hypothetical protein
MDKDRMANRNKTIRDSVFSHKFFKRKFSLCFCYLELFRVSVFSRTKSTNFLPIFFSICIFSYVSSLPFHLLMMLSD